MHLKNLALDTVRWPQRIKPFKNPRFTSLYTWSGTLPASYWRRGKAETQQNPRRFWHPSEQVSEGFHHCTGTFVTRQIFYVSSTDCDSLHCTLVSQIFCHPYKHIICGSNKVEYRYLPIVWFVLLVLINLVQDVGIFRTGFQFRQISAGLNRLIGKLFYFPKQIPTRYFFEKK